MLKRLRQLRTRVRRGSTLLEISVAVTIIGILTAMVVPGFSKAAEQNRVDAAGQYLRSIWSAERMYWLENRTYADSLALLDSLKLIDPKIVAGSDGSFTYSITSATSDAFTIKATRSGSPTWSGQLTITQEGQVSGGITSTGGATLGAMDM